jgi:hypothetical protein
MTASAMSQAAMLPAGYAEWIADVKLRIRATQQRAALAVNKELLQLYWQIGRDILDQQAAAGWGTGILSRIEADLRVEFPEIRASRRRISSICACLGGLARPERNWSTIR